MYPLSEAPSTSPLPQAAPSRRTLPTTLPFRLLFRLLGENRNSPRVHALCFQVPARPSESGRSAFVSAGTAPAGYGRPRVRRTANRAPWGQRRGCPFVMRVQGSGATLVRRTVRTGMLGPVTNTCWLCGLGGISARDNGRSDIDRFSTRTATGPAPAADAAFHGVQLFVNPKPRAGNHQPAFP